MIVIAQLTMDAALQIQSHRNLWSMHLTADMMECKNKNLLTLYQLGDLALAMLQLAVFSPPLPMQSDRDVTLAKLALAMLLPVSPEACVWPCVGGCELWCAPVRCPCEGTSECTRKPGHNRPERTICMEGTGCSQPSHSIVCWLPCPSA